MGDCRIVVSLDVGLLHPLVGQLEQHPTSRTLSIILSSDSTVESALQSLKSQPSKPDVSCGEASINTQPPSIRLKEILQQFPDATIWDATAHPVQNITANIRSTHYVQTTTLFTAGWFPSGTLHVLASSTDATRYLSSNRFHDDYQYNNIVSKDAVSLANEAGERQSAVRFVGVVHRSDGRTPLPSQVLHSVKERFADDNDDTESQKQQRQHALALKRARLAADQQAQEARHKKLDAKIRALQSKQSQSSQQVQFMLIKSRATGRVDLSQDDRVYLQVVHDTEGGEHDAILDYRYFSQQDTVGRILSALLDNSMTPSKSLQNEAYTAELLVSFRGTFRRLPSTLRLYEALERGYLVRRPVPTVIVRRYNQTSDAVTTSILEDDIDAEMDSKEEDNDDKLLKTPATLVTTAQLQAPSSEISTLPHSAMTPTTQSTITSYQRLARLLTSDILSRSKAKKKLSKSHVKVRQMRIKSKASGDAKRVKQDSDRFFVELYSMVDEESENPSLTYLGPKFAARSDAVTRLFHEHVQATRPWEALSATISLPEGSLSVRSQPLVTSANKSDNVLTWEEANRTALVDCFDIIVLRFVSDG